jgi:3-dehydroquinate synthase
VDAAIGGKTGVDVAAGKNMLGTFHQPLAVVIDPEVLETLPEREYRAGLYESIKCGIIRSPVLFELMSAEVDAVLARTPHLVERIIADSVAIKAAVVSADERESGLRMILNFGHTIGHALEAATRYRRFRHGEAVAYGMLGAARLAASRGVLAADARDRLRELIVQMGPLPAVADLHARDLLAAMSHDKKVLHRQLHFVLPVAIGRVEIVTDVSRDELAAALAAIGVSPA